MKKSWIIIYIIIYISIFKFRIIRTLEEEHEVCEDPKTMGIDCNESCFEECYECYKDGNCTSCSDKKYYGSNCDIECKKCETCDIEGICTKCKDDKFYKTDCGTPCDNCPDGCSITDGTCLNNPENCSDLLHYGDKCDIPCDKNNTHCDKCNREGICYNCKNNTFYNYDCRTSCENCPDGCSISDGVCLNNPEECLGSKHYGDKCDIECDYCNTCYRNGACITCKDYETYGTYCNTSCPEHCALNHNNKSMCNIEGQCRDCQPFYYGLICENDCHGCQSGCDNEGYCKDFKCNEGKFGLKCDEKCTCEINSKSDECGKFSGHCLNCRFGYFGKNCNDKCNYKCRTGLCCIFKAKEINDEDEDNDKKKVILKTNYKYLNIKKNDTWYKIEIDYNYGFPLILFNKKSILTDCNIANASTINNTENTDLRKLSNNTFSSYNFTNYEINGYLVTNEEIILGKEKVPLSLNITIAKQIVCKNPKEGEEKPNGVIGLGFFNTISNTWFEKQEEERKKQNKPYDPNILSYSMKDDNTIELSFGLMSEQQIFYIDKLTYCDVVFINGTDIRGKKMSCVLNGIKSSKQNEALQLNDSKITFSIGEENSLILKYDQIYKDYLMNEYFKGSAEEHFDKNTKTTFFTYPSDKINKLNNFGFVFNKYYYPYEPTVFFEDYNKEEKKFLIQLQENIDESEFILGKPFLKDIQFTINNEEARIYFYAKRAEYSPNLKTGADTSSFSLSLSPREAAAVILSVIIALNLICFVAYYFFKKKKMNSPNYIKIE